MDFFERQEQEAKERHVKLEQWQQGQEIHGMKARLESERRERREAAEAVQQLWDTVEEQKKQIDSLKAQLAELLKVKRDE